MSTRAEPVTPALLRGHALPRPDGAKGTRGHIAVIGGSRTTPGAALLSGLAALRVGAGVLAFAVPESVSVALAVAVPEASATGFPDDLRAHPDGGLDAALAVVELSDAVLVGPGLDDPEQTRVLLDVVLPAVRGRPVVLDAFALGLLPAVAGDEAALPDTLVLTPNKAEAARLLEVRDDDLGEDDTEVARAIAERWHGVVSYKGVVAGGGSSYATGTGHAGLGTSGSGDVLSGAVAGLLARGVDPLWATVWASYLHAAAGDRLAARVGALGFLARELLYEIPLVLTELQA